MNTTHDETLLALWLEDELQGEELAAVEAWAGSQPEHLAAREELRRWKATVAAAIPASEEPPFPDFFNSRIEKSIRDLTPVVIESAPRKSFWLSWFVPATAFAGMALAFWVGHRTGTPVPVAAKAPQTIPSTPAVYTPDRSVNAEWFASSEASATVIVLQGVDAIPDSLDFMATAAFPARGGQDSTAGNGDALNGEGTR